MINYTKTSLKKLIEIFNESDYIVRFEKGNFKSGYAIVKNNKVVIINKFFDTEARINILLELIDILEIEPRLLTKQSNKFYRILLRNGLILMRDEHKTEEE